MLLLKRNFVAGSELKTRYVLALLAAICGWLLFADCAQAQLTRVWGRPLSSLGVSGSAPLVDDSGNVYMLSYAGAAYSGARVTKLKNDGTTDWQSDYLYAGLELDYFGLGPDGSTYVLGHLRSDSWVTLAIAVRFDPNGNFVWDQAIAPMSASSFGFNAPKGDVDADGNFWVGVTEEPTGNACGFELSQSVMYRLAFQTGVPLEVDREDGGGRNRSFLMQVVGNGDGYVNALVKFVEYCCDDACLHCGDTCFDLFGSYQHEHTNYRTIDELRRYTDAGAFAGSAVLGSSNTVLFDSGLQQGRNGELFVLQSAFSSEITRSNTVWSRIGAWSTPLEGGAYSPGRYVTDYRGNVLLLQSIGDDGDPWYISQTCCLDGTTGAVRWTKPYSLGNRYGGDRDGHVFIMGSGILNKLDEAGNVVWSYHSPVGIYSFVSCDTAGGYYFIDGGGFAKYTDRKYLTIRDANNDSIPNVEFELIKVANDPPFFTEDTLGTFTTDDNGRLKLTFISQDTLEVELDLETDTLAIGDSLKIARLVESIPAVRHPGVLATMYSIHLDNARFDEDSHMFFDTLTSEDQDVVLDHTELRYNLLVSVEWEADQGYLQSLQGNLQAMSNYLYDVYDGQVRLDTVMIFDHGDFDAEADIMILADNSQWPGTVEYIDNLAWEGITMPRKFFNAAEDDNRNLSDSEDPLDLLTHEDFRTKAHEFGHYAFKFWDEYKFMGPTGAYVDDPSLRCTSINNYGYMDSEYSDGGELASELSSSYRYADFNCRNTEQYGLTGLSCWDYLEAQFEGDHSPDEIFVPIIKVDDSARSLPDGWDYLPGPNADNYVLPADYNVGNLIIFPMTPTAPPVGYGTLHVQVLSSNRIHPQPKAKVELVNNYFTLNPDSPVMEGYTSDKNPDPASNGGGSIRVLGANRNDCRLLVESWMRTQVLPSPGFAPLAAAGADRVWLCGEASIGGSGMTRVGNSASYSKSGDSLVIELTSISGDHAALVQAVPDGNGLEYRLHTEKSFPIDPSLEVYSSASGFRESTFSVNAGGYVAQAGDSLDDKGTFRVWAVDDSSQTFFFSTPYVRYLPDTSGLSHEWYGPGGTSLLSLDSLNTSISQIVIASSAFPVPMTGLGPEAVQAGDAISVEVDGQTQFEGNNTLSIHYSDLDLEIIDGSVGDESTLQLYHWNESSSTWEVVANTGVNPEHKTVFGSISTPGTYAAFTSKIVTDVEDDPRGEILPYRFDLSQNYPNPFNPVTTIEYSLPEGSMVTIEIYNILGQRIRTLVNEVKPAGTFTARWNGANESGLPVGTGIYLYRFRAGDYTETKKMLLLK